MARSRTQIRDPLAPLADRFLRRQVRRDVRAQINPLVDEFTRSINARAAAGARNIAGVTDELAGNLGGYEQKVGDIYGRSRDDLGAIDKEAADRLTAAGGGAEAELRKRLELSGAPTALMDSLASGAKNTGTGAVAALYGLGAAERAQLTQNEASGREYAAKLPGLARLSGAQDIGQLQAQRQRDLADRTGEIQSRVPGLISNLLGNARQREVNKSIALRGFGLDQGKLLEEQRQFDAEEARRVRDDAERARHNRQSESNTRAKATAARQGRSYNENLSRQADHAVDGRGRPIIDPTTGEPYPYDPAKAGKKRKKPGELGGWTQGGG